MRRHKRRASRGEKLAQSNVRTCAQQLAESNLRAAALNNAAGAGRLREKLRRATCAKHIALSRLVQRQFAQSQLHTVTREKHLVRSQVSQSQAALSHLAQSKVVRACFAEAVAV